MARKEEHTLDQWAMERSDQHRAMLIWAMQAEGVSANGLMHRNASVSATCVGMSQSAISKWANQYQWAARLQGHGEEASAYALELYRRLYIEEHGAKDLPRVQHLVAIDLPSQFRTTPVQEKAEKQIRRVVHKVRVNRVAPPLPPPKTEEEVGGAIAAAVSEQQKSNKALRSIAKQALIQLSESIKKGEAKARVGDLRMLRDLLADLDKEAMRLESPETARLDGLAVQDSVRVRLAKEQGTDVMLAHYEDLLEAQLLFEALLSSNEQKQKQANGLH